MKTQLVSASKVWVSYLLCGSDGEVFAIDLFCIMTLFCPSKISRPYIQIKSITRLKRSYYLQLLRHTRPWNNSITATAWNYRALPRHLCRPLSFTLFVFFKVLTSSWLSSSPSAPLMRVQCVQDSPSDPWMVMAIPAAPTAHTITAGTPAWWATEAGKRGRKKTEYLGVVVTRK